VSHQHNNKSASVTLRQKEWAEIVVTFERKLVQLAWPACHRNRLQVKAQIKGDNRQKDQGKLIHVTNV